MMKALQFMAIRKICLYIILLSFSALSSCKDSCLCERHRYSMAKIIISDKSLDKDDIEIRCVGRYCCSREKGGNDWTVIRKDYADIISSNNKLHKPNDYYPKEIDSICNLGFHGLRFDLFNIKDINDIDKLDKIVDSMSLLPNTSISSIYFDYFPKFISFELKDTNGFLVKNIIVNVTEKK